jgi:hypothetical protein
MKRQVAHKLFLYTFVVLMILLRPYIAYKISMQGGEFARDPDRVARILSRLVKKKESHVHDTEEAIELIMATDVEIILPALLLLTLRRRLSWLLSILSVSADDLKRSTIFQVSPSNHYYRLISRLQI